VFSWNHTEPCGKSSALPEGCPVADRSNRGSGNHWSDSRNRDQSPAGFKFVGDAHDQLVGFLDLSVQVLHLQPQLG
jgi:hypothetical protein